MRSFGLAARLWKLRSLRTEKLSIRTPFIDVGRATVPLGRLASGSWSQLSTPTLDKTRPLLAGTMEVYQRARMALDFPSDYSAFIRKSVEISRVKVRKSVEIGTLKLRKSVAG